jgi:hypothetical protein
MHADGGGRAGRSVFLACSPSFLDVNKSFRQTNTYGDGGGGGGGGGGGDGEDGGDDDGRKRNEDTYSEPPSTDQKQSCMGGR